MFSAWLLAGALAPAQADAPGTWTANVDVHGLRQAQVAGKARLGEREVPARLRLYCRPGTDGSVGWTLLVEQADSLAEFGFADFEGPDAVAAEQRLATLALQGGLLQPRFDTTTSGFYAEADTFAFEFSAPANAASQAALLADSVGPQSQGLSWSVRDYRDAQRTLAATFALGDGATAIRDTMMGCGPPPPLGPEQYSAWMGRNPAGVELWSQRAIDWRLRAALGASYAAVRARLQQAEPLGESGGVYFVLAPDAGEPASGVAVMLSADGDAEVIVIDAGQVTRHPLRGTIDAPEPVRAFIGARVGEG